jgi:hypothetical protein
MSSCDFEALRPPPPRPEAWSEAEVSIRFLRSRAALPGLAEDIKALRKERAFDIFEAVEAEARRRLQAEKRDDVVVADADEDDDTTASPTDDKEEEEAVFDDTNEEDEEDDETKEEEEDDEEAYVKVASDEEDEDDAVGGGSRATAALEEVERDGDLVRTDSEELFNLLARRKPEIPARA